MVHPRPPRVPLPGLLSVLILLCAKSLPASWLAHPTGGGDRALRMRRVDTSNLLDCAAGQWKTLPDPARFAAAGAGSVAGSLWTPIGPEPIHELGCCGSTIEFDANGRVNSIAVHPSDPNRLYLGSAGGGIWRSNDGGSTWTPLTDSQPSLGIGSSHAIAIDPNDPDILYAGTSNFALLAQSQPRPIDFAQSRGILKSTDGGDSWLVLGSGIPSGNNGNAQALFSNTEITTILVDPSNSDALYLSAGRGGFPTVDGGLFFSTDAGVTWTPGTDGAGIAESLVLDTSSPAASRILYAGLYQKGVRKSTDGGQSWTAVLDATTQAVIDAGATGFTKVMVSLAPTSSPPNPDGQVLYAALLVGGKAMFFENTKGGASDGWQRKNAIIVGPTGFGPFVGGAFSDMVVDPASPGDGVNDRILYGGETQWLSKDSGDTFSEIGQIHGTHGDHQTFLVVPQSGTTSTLYIGDDGGIWKSGDEGATWTGTSEPGSPATINAGGLQIGTFYALSVKQDATASETLGGMQDSGRGRMTGSVTWTGTSNDGIDVLFEKMAPDVAYSVENCGPSDCLLKSTDSGANFSDITPSTIPASDRAVFQNRLAVDPNNAGYVYFGGSNGSVYRSLDGAGTFQMIGQPAAGQYVASLDVAAGDSNRLVIATNLFTPGGAANAVSNGVFVTRGALDSAPTFGNLTAGLPTRFVTRVAFDPSDPDVVYATLAGFGATTAIPGHVFRRTLTAAGWTDISPPVDVPVNALALDGTSVPTVLYIGTDLGVLRTVDAGASWEVVDDIHLPNAAVSDLDINLQAGVMRAATWGRGVFELVPPTGPVIDVAPAALDFGETCAVTGADRTIDVSNVGTQDLVVLSVERLAGSPSFSVNPSPATPLTLGAGAHAAFTVQYTPPVPGGPESAIVRIASNDPLAPFVDVPATGALETTPPTITGVTATPAVLWPPSHKMKTVGLQAAVTDNCDTSVAQSCEIILVESNEPIEGTGDGDTSPDWVITGNLTARLRAERAGSGSGRIYSLTVRCTDSAGNSSTGVAHVLVPLEGP